MLRRPPLALARRIGLMMSSRPIPVGWPGGVVSFTFDDFPKSAFVTGGSIIERHGARATYYVSMRLAGTNDILGRMFDYQDILAAHRAGHEIACHTHAHPNCHGATSSLIRAEVRENAAAISSVMEGFIPTNFAYPYGSVSVRAKYVLGPRFSSCRGIGRGINHGTADLADLLAINIYAADFDEWEMRRLIDTTTAIGGWLIFYTHDVVETPSPYGCKASQLETIVAYAARRTTVLPVRNVILGLIRDGRATNSAAARFSFALGKVRKRINSKDVFRPRVVQRH